jgi:PAT family beta-lactamase induction signal transducer AmpG
MTANSPVRKRRMMDTLAALRRPKVAVMAALGFSSGLPFLLTGNTLGYWLREGHISLTAISFASWVGLTYTLKFIWAPVIDRVAAPLLGGLGRRRGWMLLAQALIGLGLLAMGMIGPQGGLVPLGAAALVVAFASATQDIVVDAWRIEIADDPDEVGLLTSAYSLGYRAALLITESVILILAQWFGWPLSYAVMALLVLIGVTAVLFAKEPEAADAAIAARAAAAPLTSVRGLFDAIVGPFIAFFKEHGAFAAVMLLTITLYHLPDYLRGPISNPFYKDLGIQKTTVGLVRGTIGLWCSILGVSAGGIAAVRLGYGRALILGGLIQPPAIALFALLALRGYDLSLYEAVMGFDAFAMSFSGVALVAYMSSLTSLGYTATQYAVLTSALAWTGKTLKGFSGAVVDGLQHGRDLMHAYALFYLGAAVFGVPAIVLCIILAREIERRRTRVPAV